MEKNYIEKTFAERKELESISNIDQKLKQTAATLNINLEDLKKAYGETGDFVSAELQALERKVLSRETSNTITLNGNIIPEELYEIIAEAANTAILFKQDRASLAQLITSLQEGDSILLSPIQIAQLLVNVSEEDKPLFTEEEKEIINGLATTTKAYSAEEAQTILRFLECKRLSTKENTDLYNRIIKSLKRNHEYEPLLTEKGTLIRTNEQTTYESKSVVKRIERNSENKKNRHR